MRIAQANVYSALDREQWTGYNTGYVEIGGERITFVTLTSCSVKAEGDMIPAYQTSEELAWDAFDLGLDDWLKDKPGIVLWRRTPECRKERLYRIDSYAEWDAEAKQYGPGNVELSPVDLYYVVARIAVTENRAFVDQQRVEDSIAA